MMFQTVDVSYIGIEVLGIATIKSNINAIDTELMLVLFSMHYLKMHDLNSSMTIGKHIDTIKQELTRYYQTRTNNVNEIDRRCSRHL